jgi:polysaccharide pyruvyl transferase WcaK-like protein
MRRLRIHIGHHFFGAGNIGDDLMLAGFARASGPFLDKVQFTCCIPHDIQSQAYRFPLVQWHPYEPDVRADLVKNCDVWLGLGDTPFQTDSGSWFIDHLHEEFRLCSRFRRPMYFLGVGVNDREALVDGRIAELLGSVSRIWTRDPYSFRLISGTRPDCHVVEGADLGNIELGARPAVQLNSDEIGFVLNFEVLPADFLEDFAVTASKLACRKLVWMSQEVRRFQWSESRLIELFPDSAASYFVRRKPDYSAATLQTLLDALSGADMMLTSRYHAGLLAAWQGSRIALYCRNEKLKGLASQLAITPFWGFGIEAVESALANSKRVNRNCLLVTARQAENAVSEFFEAALG